MRSVTILLYRQHRRKTRKRMCRILTHQGPTGSSVCENSVSLPSVVKPWTTHIAQNIAETCQKYFQSFIAIEILPQHFCQLVQNISLQD